METSALCAKAPFADVETLLLCEKRRFAHDDDIILDAKRRYAHEAEEFFKTLGNLRNEHPYNLSSKKSLKESLKSLRKAVQDARHSLCPAMKNGQIC